MPETVPSTPDGIEIVEDVSRDFKGTAFKFKTDEPVTLHGDTDFRDTIETQYFVVSAAFAPFSGPETMVFPAEEEGTEPISWGEVAGGMRTGHNIEGVLREFADRYLD